MEKTKSVNRSAELEFVAEVNDIKPGTEWERVNKLVDFNAKHAKSTKDTTRYISLLKSVHSSSVLSVSSSNTGQQISLRTK